MTPYRSLETIKAVQYQGEPIPDVTCQGSNEEFLSNGCDSSRRNVPHVHTMAVGGMTCLQKGDWIFPLHGGPFGVASDAKFRSHWEVAEEIAPATVMSTGNITPAGLHLVEAATSQTALAATPTHTTPAAPPDAITPVPPPAPAE